MGRALDEPLLLEPGERGANAGPADAERPRQVCLDEPLLRLEVSEDDGLAKIVGNIVDDSVVNDTWRALIGKQGFARWLALCAGRR